MIVRIIVTIALLVVYYCLSKMDYEIDKEDIITRFLGFVLDLTWHFMILLGIIATWQ